MFFEITNTTATKHIFAGANRIASIESNLVNLTAKAGLTDSTIQTSSTNYFHSDHLGSSNCITDKDGKQLCYIEFVPYGSTFRNTGLSTQVTVPIKYLFTGKELDSTGLYYYGARYYDPVIGRFITADTIVQAPYDPQSLNRYSYCRNNPINYVDPTGHKWSWKKFWHAVVGVFTGVVTSIFVGPAGFAWVGSTMAGIIGGATGGALTGGFDGGWKGALIGGAIGGALGGLGGWGVNKFGWKFGAGMLVAGAGAAGATDSWDSFAGGLVGGLAGWGVGSGVTSAFQQKQENNIGHNFDQSTSEHDRGVNNALRINEEPDLLLDNPTVKAGSDRMWIESKDGQAVVNEQGAFISKNENGSYDFSRWPQGERGHIRVPSVRPPGTVGEIHTHPYSSSEIFVAGPSGNAANFSGDFHGFNNPASSVYGLRHFIRDRHGIIEYHDNGEWQYKRHN